MLFPITVSNTLLAFYMAINVMAFLVMLWDKRAARMSGAERVSEGLLFFMATAFGAAGVFLGMFAFRHKTRTWYFLIGIPLAFISNLALLRFLAERLRIGE
ncbi:MAG: DUF1294 domain-containing protein [Candidatus Moraniibacteriota bacterium]|nr:MAG: DUF1294 domain-containing protein [Candidatus Moranbacteria bacterium]